MVGDPSDNRQSQIGLEPPHDEQDEHDDKRQAEAAAGHVAPGCRVIPCRQRPQQEQNQHYDEDGPDHATLNAQLGHRFKEARI